MKRNILLIPFVALMFVGCARYYFESRTENVAQAADQVAKNLGFNSRMKVAEDSFELVLTDSEDHTMGFLRLSQPSTDTGRTWIQTDFQNNEYMPKNIFRGFFLECIEQQIQLNSGIQNPSVNPEKSFYKYQIANLFSPSAATYYGLHGNPFYYPYAKYPLIATQGIMEFGAIMTAIGYFDSSTKSQKNRYTNAFLFYYGVSRGIGAILGWNIKYYEKTQHLSYDLSSMHFYF